MLVIIVGGERRGGERGRGRGGVERRRAGRGGRGRNLILLLRIYIYFSNTPLFSWIIFDVGSGCYHQL